MTAACLIGRALIAEIRVALLTWKGPKKAQLPPGSLLASHTRPFSTTQPRVPQQRTSIQNFPVRVHRSRMDLCKERLTHKSMCMRPLVAHVTPKLGPIPGSKTPGKAPTTTAATSIVQWPCGKWRWGPGGPSGAEPFEGISLLPGEAGTACDIGPNVSPFPATKFPSPGAGRSGQSLSHEGRSPAPLSPACKNTHERGWKMVQGITKHAQRWRFPVGLPLPGPARPIPSHTLATSQHGP